MISALAEAGMRLENANHPTAAAIEPPRRTNLTKRGTDNLLLLSVGA